MEELAGLLLEYDHLHVLSGDDTSVHYEWLQSLFMRPHAHSLQVMLLVAQALAEELLGRINPSSSRHLLGLCSPVAHNAMYDPAPRSWIVSKNDFSNFVDNVFYAVAPSDDGKAVFRDPFNIAHHLHSMGQLPEHIVCDCRVSLGQLLSREVAEYFALSTKYTSLILNEVAVDYLGQRGWQMAFYDTKNVHARPPEEPVQIPAWPVRFPVNANNFARFAFVPIPSHFLGHDDEIDDFALNMLPYKQNGIWMTEQAMQNAAKRHSYECLLRRSAKEYAHLDNESRGDVREAWMLASVYISALQSQDRVREEIQQLCRAVESSQETTLCPDTLGINVLQIQDSFQVIREYTSDAKKPTFGQAKSIHDMLLDRNYTLSSSEHATHLSITISTGKESRHVVMFGNLEYNNEGCKKFANMLKNVDAKKTIIFIPRKNVQTSLAMVATMMSLHENHAFLVVTNSRFVYHYIRGIRDALAVASRLARDRYERGANIFAELGELDSLFQRQENFTIVTPGDGFSQSSYEIK